MRRRFVAPIYFDLESVPDAEGSPKVVLDSLDAVLCRRWRWVLRGRSAGGSELPQAASVRRRSW
jgi:hypothetical protein